MLVTVVGLIVAARLVGEVVVSVVTAAAAAAAAAAADKPSDTGNA